MSASNQFHTAAASPWTSEDAWIGSRRPILEAHALPAAVYADQESMLAEVMAIAGQIAANSPLAVTGCKEMLNFSRDHSVEDSLKYMATWQAGMFRPDDMMLTFQAQAQKQQAEYPDLVPIKELFEA